MRSSARVHDEPFSIPAAGGVTLAQRAWQSVASAAVAVARATPIGKSYQRAVLAEARVPFYRRALHELRIELEVEPADLARVPSSGPLVVVANHPFGAADGLALLELIGRVRADVRILANHWLAALPELSGQVMPIDAFGGRRARGRNIAALREAMGWLRAGRCVCVFPAGEVAHAERGDTVIDSPWRTTAARLAVGAGAAVLPVRFEGHNSRLFRLAGRIHPFLRTVLLPRELWARRGTAVRVRVGDAESASTLAGQGTPSARTEWLRSRVDALGDRRPAEDVAARGDVDAMSRDVAALRGTELVESGAFAVYCATASDLPHVLPEIGRLRELTFRSVGEGTGRARDLDAFDDRYLHLFVWDREHSEVGGAYRLCPTDGLGPLGVEGLYTRTLFDFDQELLNRLGPALELGRSFVAPAYQRDFSPLLLLWKGIGRFVARTPRYRFLFGAVSISDRYRSTTRELMAAFLSSMRDDAGLAALVRARHPLPTRRWETSASDPPVSTLEDLSVAVKRLEGDGKDIPVLLRQYLRLNARLLAFSVDPGFGEALDGLLVVDLTQVDAALLGRYMGRADAQTFRRRHGAVPAVRAAPTAGPWHPIEAGEGRPARPVEPPAGFRAQPHG